MGAPSWNNLFLFGQAVRMQAVPNASAAQVETFFGVSGTAVLYGGSRGTTFTVTGVFAESDVATVLADETPFYAGTANSIVGAQPATLVDTYGRSWPNVYFLGEYQPDPMGVKPAGSLFIKGYKLVMRSLQ